MIGTTKSRKLEATVGNQQQGTTRPPDWPFTDFMFCLVCSPSDYRPDPTERAARHDTRYEQERGHKERRAKGGSDNHDEMAALIKAVAALTTRLTESEKVSCSLLRVYVVAGLRDVDSCIDSMSPIERYSQISPPIVVKSAYDTANSKFDSYHLV